MTTNVKALVWVGIVTEVLFALAAGLVGWQASLLADVAEPVPHTVTAAELLAKGSGDNAHIRLTEFKFDSPLIEERNGEWRNVWIPILPKDQPEQEARALLFLRPGGIQNEEQLDRLLDRTTLDLLVTNKLPQESLWKVAPNEFVWNAFPSSDTAQALFLTEPRLRIFNAPVLTANRLCDSGFVHLCWGVAGGVGLVALVMLAFVLLSSGGTPAPAHTVNVAVQGELATETPLSRHTVRFGSAALRTILPAIGGVVGILFMPAAIAQAVHSVRIDRPVGGVIFGLVALIGPGLLCWVAWSLFNRIWRIEVCPSGLRWIQGGRNLRHWSEVAGVKRVDHVHTIQRPTGPTTFQWTTLTITFHTGEVLNLSSETMADFEGLFAALETYHCQQHTAARVRASASSVLNPSVATGVPWASR